MTYLAKIISYFLLLIGAWLSCGKGSDGGKAISIAGKILVDSGDDQNVDVRSNLKNAIKFSVVDMAGQPLAGVPIAFHLFQIPDEEIDLTDALLSEIIANEMPSVNSKTIPNNLEEVEFLGRIEKSGQASDENGLLTIESFISPDMYYQRIGIIAYSTAPNIKAMGLATLSTGGFVSSDHLSLSSANHLLEQSNEPFQLWTALHRDSVPVHTYYGELDVTISFQIPEHLFSNLPPTIKTKCKFEFGQCLLEGGPFVVGGQGRIDYIVKAKQFPKASEGSILIGSGNPAEIVLSYTLPPQKGESYEPVCPHERIEGRPCLEVTADTDSVDLYALVIDENKHFLYETPTHWEVTGSLKGKIKSDVVPSKQEIYPNRTGEGELIVTSTDGFKVTVPYKVVAGNPHFFTLRSEHENEEIATDAFSAIVRAFDKNNNFCDNYSGQMQMEFGLTDVSNSPNGTPPSIDWTEELSFSAGIGISSKSLQATNAANKPSIKLVYDEQTFYSDKIQMSPGNLDALAFRNASMGGGDVIDNPITLQKGIDTITVYTAGHDALGNFIGDMNAAYTADGSIIGALSTTQAQVVSIAPTQIGVGHLIASYGGKTLTSPDINVTEPFATKYRVEIIDSGSAINNNISAGERFNIRVTGLDVDNIVAVPYEKTVTLNFSSVGPSSWAGINPLLPEGDLDCDFIAGVCNLPPPPGETGWYLTGATQKIILTVTDTSGEIPNDWAASIVASTSAPASLVVADKLGGPAANAVVWTESPLTITSDDTLTLAAAIIDSGGNYLQDATAATWSASTNLISNYLSSTSGAQTDFSPVEIIPAASNEYLQVSSPGYPNQQVFIAVEHGIPTQLAFSFELSSPITAGTCSGFSASLLDSDGNTATKITLSTNVNFALKDANTGTVVLDPKYADASELIPGESKIWDYGVGDWIYAPTGFYSAPDTVNYDKMVSFIYDATYSELPYAAGSFTENSDAVWPSGSKNTPINAGVISPSYKICFHDATNVAPKLEIGIPALSLSDGTNYPAFSDESAAQSVLVGSEYDLAFFSASDELLCHRETLADTASICSKSSAANTNFELNPYIVDFSGNKIRAASGSWDTSSLPGSISTSLGANDKLTISGQEANPQFGIDYTDSSSSFTSPFQFCVLPGPPTDFSLSADIIRATSQFGLTLKLQDTYGNVHQDFYLGQSICPAPSSDLETAGELQDAVIDISVTSGTPENSPIGTTPIIPSQIIDDFVQGFHYTDKVFLLPKAGNSIDLTVDLSYSSLGLSASHTLSVTSSLGSLDSVSVRSGPLGTDTVVSNPTLSAGDIETWYVLGADLEGNIAAVDSTINTTGIIAPYVTFTSPNIIKVEPEDVGTGEIEITPDPSISATTISTGTITIASGDVDYFELAIPSNPSANVTAGTAYDLTVTAYDEFGNQALTFTGQQTLAWSVVGSTLNPEDKSIAVPSDGDCSFTLGVCTISAELIPYNSLNTPTVYAVWGNGFDTATGSILLTIASDSFDHYGVVSDSTYQPTPGNVFTFTAAVFRRDAYGNNLLDSPPATVNLSIVNDDGSAASGSLFGTTALAIGDFSSGSASVSDLSYQGVGDFRILASDGTTNTPLTATNTIQMLHNELSIASYQITTDADWQAGVAEALSITALDALGNVVDFDSNGSGLSFSLTTTEAGGFTAPNSDPLSLSTIEFFSGIANFTATVKRAYTYPAGTVEFSDDQATPRSGSFGSGITVSPGTYDHMVATPSSTSLSAGDSLSATVYTYDSFNNLTLTGCENLSFSISGGGKSPGGGEGTVTSPILPSESAASATGYYAAGPITLYKAGSNVLVFEVCGDTTSETITVAPAPLDSIWFSLSNSEPTFHQSDPIECGESAGTVSCPQIYAFGWDAYGNNRDGSSFECLSWSYTPISGDSGLTPSTTADSHNTTLSSSKAIYGNLQCDVGAISQTALMSGKVARRYDFSCGYWFCSSSQPTATCRVDNNTGYDINNIGFSAANSNLSLDVTGCTTSLTSGILQDGQSCLISVTGPEEEASNLISISADAVDPESVHLSNPLNIEIEGGELSPLCSTNDNELIVTYNSDWQCRKNGINGEAFWLVEVENIGATSITMPVAAPSGANGEVILSTCHNTSLAQNETCDLNITQSSAGLLSYIEINPSNASTLALSQGYSPNCSASLQVSILEINSCIASPVGSKTLRVTFTNNNSLNSFDFSGFNLGNGELVSTTCSNLGPGGSCTLEVSWEGVASNDFSISTSDLNGYFESIALSVSDADNSCP